MIAHSADPTVIIILERYDDYTLSHLPKSLETIRILDSG